MEQDDYDFDDMNYFDEDIVQALDHVEEVYLSTQRMNSTADDMPANPIIKEELNDTLPVDRSMIDNSLDIYRSERERLLNHKNQVDHTLESTQKQLKEVRNELKYKDQRIDSLKREIAMMKGKVKNAEEIPDTSRKRALLSQHTELLQLYKKPALHPLSRNSPSPMDLSRASSVVPSDYKLSGLSQVTSSLATIKQEMPSGVSNQRTPRITANTLENDTEMEKKRRLQNAILIPYVTRADITNKPISTVNNIDSLTADKLSEYCQQYTRQLIPSNISREASEKLLILANDIAQCIDSRHNFSIAVKQLLSLTGDCLLIYMKEKIDMKTASMLLLNLYI
ncbi:hypothetical protein BDB01DRAFT_114044 [Pilobolus umbonatus]|nr:hypothetical protein BDB01DRAFT_114044 [Pilobolus umbonatus]